MVSSQSRFMILRKRKRRLLRSSLKEAEATLIDALD